MYNYYLYQMQTIQKDYQTTKTYRPASAMAVLDNSINPFHTAAIKPTCGYFFSQNTDNKRYKIGIHSSNLTAWRSVYTNRPTRAQTAR